MALVQTRTAEDRDGGRNAGESLGGRNHFSDNVEHPPRFTRREQRLVLQIRIGWLGDFIRRLLRGFRLIQLRTLHIHGLKHP